MDKVLIEERLRNQGSDTVKEISQGVHPFSEDELGGISRIRCYAPEYKINSDLMSVQDAQVREQAGR